MESSAAEQPLAPTTEGRLRGIVSSILERHMPRKVFSRDETLAAIGLASFDMISLMLAVESEFNLTIPQNEITADTFRSIATIEAMVHRLSVIEVATAA